MPTSKKIFKFLVAVFMAPAFLMGELE